jgi:peptidoglycan-associated lipoprotein
MKHILVAVCAALVVAGCGSKGATSSQGKAAIEQRSVSDQKPDQQAADEAAKQARIQQEQEQLKQQVEEQKRRQEEAAKVAAEQPVVKPLADTSMTGKALTDPASMLKDPASPLSKRSIYYDFDAYNIKEEYQHLVEAHGKFLLEHKEFKVRIVGNCDERGSREYNLALGQHRAEAVKKRLVLLGVAANRIETVSLGKEKPRALCHDESCWHENRRTDFIDTWK